jgi:hypothetical protein
LAAPPLDDVRAKGVTTCELQVIVR